MQIYFERSGGFMGMLITGTVNTDSLPEEEVQKLRQMVDTAGFFELPPSLPSSTQGADQFQYKLVIEDEGREHSVETSDAAAPDTLQPLLRRLTVLARSQLAE